MKNELLIIKKSRVNLHFEISIEVLKELRMR